MGLKFYACIECITVYTKEMTNNREGKIYALKLLPFTQYTLNSAHEY